MQHDYLIADADGLSFLADLNDFCAAVVSNNSGSGAPAVTYAYMPWSDTTTGLMKQRNAANSAWVTLYTLSSGNLAQLGGMTLTGEINTKRSTVAATATNTPMWDAGYGNIQDWTGTPNITNLPAAPQAGAWRIVYPAAGTVFTDNANIDVQGDANHTVVAGEQFYIEALTTTTFKIFIKSKSNPVLTTGDQSISGDKTFSGDVLINATSVLGYTTGSGGAVTQLTSKSTGVTLNTPSGSITMNSASLAANTTVGFILTNNLITARTMLLMNSAGGGDVKSYDFNSQPATGSATIYVRNISAGALAEPIVINFVLINGANS
jgi:hypothetical protein